MSAAQLQMGASVPFKRLASPSLGKMLQPESSTTANLQVPYLKAGHVQWHGVELPEDLPMMWASAADVKELTPKPGDLLICEGGEVGRAALAPLVLPENTIIQNSLHLVRETNQACPRYLKYALEHVASTGWLDLVCNKATIAHLTVDKLRELPIPYWDKNGQGRIANFLDEQTARIDALIAEKERLTQTLKEAIWDEVTRAVTLGISGASTRETSLDWCPEVPRHWDVLLLKRLLLKTEYGISDSMASEGAVAILRMGNISDGKVTLDDLKYVDEVPGELLLRKGDVLYNRTNSLAQVGKVGLVRETPTSPLSFASYLVRLVPNERVIPEYLGYLLNCPAVLAIARSLALPAIGQANLNPTRYGYIHVPCPPVSEQGEIVRHLDARTTQIAALSKHAEEHIERLREYRASLISAAVTGQLAAQSPGAWKEPA